MLKPNEKNTLKNILKAFIPDKMHSDIRRKYSKVKYTLGSSCYCPICKSKFRKFKPCGRPNCECPVCGSRERHRLAYKFFDAYTGLFEYPKKKMLHAAPNSALEKIFKENKIIQYLSGDINKERAMEKLDVTDIKYPDETFDVIYVSHVLEHVSEDRRAMRELHRVLDSGGWAVLQVPINAEETIEDPSITDPEQRRRLFGQPGHVRRYGPDYRDRLEEAGFDVTTYPAPEVVGEENVQKMGVMEDEDIYFCEKN